MKIEVMESTIDKSCNNLSNNQEWNLCKNIEFWMTELPPYLKTIPIIHLAIPGSHNSMTYTIKRFNNVGPDESAILQFFGKYFSIISKPIVFNWSVTQYDDVTEQFRGGIRYLDFRLATKSNDGEIYFVHGLFGDEVTQHLLHISNWLALHPAEVVIIDCQHFYSFTENRHQYFIRKMKAIFGSTICPTRTHLSKISLSFMIRNKYQVIIIYRNETAKRDQYLWPSGLWPTPWPNTTRPNVLIDFLNLRLKTRLPDIGFVSQCLLTPDVKFVLKHFCGSLHRDLGNVCRKTTLKWIQEQQPGGSGLNIVITDFVSFDNYSFSKMVVQRNAQLMDGEDVTRLGIHLKDKGVGSRKSSPQL